MARTKGRTWSDLIIDECRGELNCKSNAPSEVPFPQCCFRTRVCTLVGRRVYQSRHVYWNLRPVHFPTWTPSQRPFSTVLYSPLTRAPTEFQRWKRCPRWPQRKNGWINSLIRFLSASVNCLHPHVRPLGHGYRIVLIIADQPRNWNVLHRTWMHVLKRDAESLFDAQLERRISLIEENTTIRGSLSKLLVVEGFREDQEMIGWL